LERYSKEKQDLNLWNSYVFGKQTLRELSEDTNISKRTLKRKFEKLHTFEKQHNPRLIHLVVDATFFGKRNPKQWGVIVFRDWNKKENLWWKFVDEETVSAYVEGKDFIEAQGYRILSVTCDGFRGLTNVFKGIPVQFCHFHQKQIIQRYVTRNPRLEAGKDLLEIVKTLPIANEKETTIFLKKYLSRYKNFLNEKTTDPLTGRWSFTHKRLRSAIKSLTVNLPYLFTYRQYPKLNIPTTTNTLESHFSHLKDILRIHRGLSRKMKEKVIHTVFLNSSIVKKKDT
jgi:hypothetical protein